MTVARRPTIVDIARAAGVSKGAVSYALNGRPGVSAGTRERILAIADELGWVPSSAARALSNDRAGAIGLVAVRRPELVATEPFFMSMLAGIEQVLSRHELGLLLTIVEDVDAELDVYRRWWAGRRVDGVLLSDMRTDDPRPDLCRELAIPAVVHGAVRAYTGLPATRVDDHDDMVGAVRHLAAAGHRRIARVSGPRRLEHVERRWQAFAEAGAAQLGAEPPQEETDYTARAGLAATRRLLAATVPPTAIVYDNDVMAAAAVAELTTVGVRVPHDLAVLAWDDSPLCELVRPAVTAYAHDVTAEAKATAELLLEHVETGAAADRPLGPRRLVVRGSTAPGRT